MLLVIDVGNSETKLGWFERSGDLRRTWRMTTDRRRTADEYGALFAAFFPSATFDVAQLEAIVISSVVPQVDRALAHGCRDYCFRRPVFFSAARQRLMEIRTDRPAEVGADLIAAAVGAVSRYGAPVIVIGFGTATTFGAVAPDGAYIGAAFAPGIQIALDALAANTAKLPQIALHAPPAAIGRETIASLQSGIVYGFVGLVEELVGRFQNELGVRAHVIATGGLADVVAKHTGAIDAVDPHLTFEGLRLFYASTTNHNASSPL